MTPKAQKQIDDIKADIASIKDNHLAHIEADMASMDKRIEKMDNRLWWVLGLLVASTVVAMVGDKVL